MGGEGVVISPSEQSTSSAADWADGVKSKKTADSNATDPERPALVGPSAKDILIENDKSGVSAKGSADSQGSTIDYRKKRPKKAKAPPKGPPHPPAGGPKSPSAQNLVGGSKSGRICSRERSEWGSIRRSRPRRKSGFKSRRRRKSGREQLG